MALEDAQDIEDLFDVNDFAETVTLASVSTVVLWSNPQSNEFDEMESTDPAIRLPASKLGAAVVGSTVVRAAVSYVIHEIVLDTTGKIATCYLKRG